MYYLHRFILIRSSFRFLSSSIVNVNSFTTEKELYEISKLMKHYNDSHLPIRTIALFEWMLNVINLKPNFTCYLHIIRASGDINNLNTCQKLHQFIENDRTLQDNEYRQLQIKLFHMYVKTQNIELAEEIFCRAKASEHRQIDASLFATMFKGEFKKIFMQRLLELHCSDYNMNGQPNKTIELHERETLQKKNS